jgi:FkbM family methyltransferase
MSYRQITFFILKDILGLKTVPVKIHGSYMMIDLRNDGISKTLWVFRTRENLDVELVKKELRPGMNILEVGANIGYYLFLELKAMKGKGRIFAFEPDPRNVNMLKKSIPKNDKEKIVEFHPCGVSDKDGENTFHIADKSNLSTFTGNSTLEKSKKITVKTIRIDNFKNINVPINFVRMDIEGYEFEAISGMMETLARSPKVKMLIELHPKFYGKERNFSSVILKLFEMGFKVKYAISAEFHSPKEIINKGYSPTKISYEAKYSHGLFENIKNEDFIQFLENPKKIIRSVFLQKNND